MLAVEWGSNVDAGCPEGVRAAVEEAQGLLRGGLIDKVLQRLTAVVVSDSNPAHPPAGCFLAKALH